MIEHLHDREKALEPFGLKGREAEWVALVCLHSGVFTRSQFCFYFDGAFRNRAERFVRALVDRRLAVEDDRAIFPGGARACRISNKEIYRKLGIENVRHRRDADDSVMLRRLALASTTFWNTRSFPGFLPSRKRSASLNRWASTAAGFPTGSIRGPWGNKPATLP